MRAELWALAELTESLDSRLLPSGLFSVSFGMYPRTGPAKLTRANLVSGVHVELPVIM